MRLLPRSRRLRWPLLAVLALALLAAIAALAIHLTLRSDLPRRWVLEALRANTGLRVEAASMSTTWGGRTVLRGVTLAQPLDDEPFLAAPEMRVSHTGVLGLILWRAVEIRGVEIDRPELRANQDRAGAWNVAEAARTIALAQRKPAGAGGGGGPARLPRVRVRDATVRVAAAGREATVFEGLSLEGEPVGDLVWRFHAEAPRLLSLDGRVVPWPVWRHEVDIDAPRLAALLAPWVDAPPEPLSFHGRWVGQIEDGTPAGRLRVDQLLVSDLVASGAVALAQEWGEPALHVHDLRVAAGPRLPEAIVIESGTLRQDAGKLLAEGVAVRFLGIAATLDASWDAKARTGKSRVAWAGQPLGPVARHDGVLDATFSLPATGRITVTADLETHGQAWGGEWDGQLRARLDGTGPGAFDAELTAPRLVWTDQGGPVRADGLALGLAMRRPMLRLTRLRVPEAATTAATAELNLDTKAWRLDLEVGRWVVPRLPADPAGVLAPDRPVTLAARGRGDASRATLETLRFTSGPLALRASGDYVRDRAPEQLTGEAEIEFRLPEAQGKSGLAPSGTAKLYFDLRGNVRPLKLTAAGTLAGPDLRLGENPLADLTVPWTVEVNDRAVAARVPRFEFLGGAWDGGADLSFAKRVAHVRGSTEGLSLERLTALLGWPFRLGGTLSGEFASDVPDLNLGDIEVAGRWSVAALETAAFRGEKGGGKFRWTRGRVSLDEVRIEQAGGFAEGSLHFNIEDRQKLHVDLRTTRWPVTSPAGDIRLLVDGRAALEVDLAARGATGEVGLAAETIVRGNSAGTVTAEGGVRGRTIEIASLQGRLYTGEIHGRLVVPLDDWINTQGELGFRDLDLSVLADGGLPTRGLSGRASGSLTATRSNDPRALEPLVIRLDIESSGEFRGVPFGDVHATVYAGSRRVILDASSIDVAHGTARLWMSLSQRDRRPFAHAVLNMEQLDLDLLVHALAPEANPMPGLVGGAVRAFGFISPPHRAAGDADILLTNSDLARSDIIGAVHNAMNLDVGDVRPEGRGRATLRLEGESVVLERLGYFNRGVEVLATGSLHDISRGVDSPISVHAAGTARPLREVKLLSSLDGLLQALQASMTAVEARGTLREPQPRVIPLPAVSSALGRLLQGRVEEEHAAKR